MDQPVSDQNAKQQLLHQKMRHFFIILGSFLFLIGGFAIYVAGGLIAVLPMMLLMGADPGASTDVVFLYILIIIMALVAIFSFIINIYFAIIGVKIGGLTYSPEKLETVLNRIKYLAIFSPLLWLPLLFLIPAASNKWLPIYANFYQAAPGTTHSETNPMV